MKKICLLFTAILLLCVMTSCEVNTADSPDVGDTGSVQSGTNETSGVGSVHTTNDITEPPSVDTTVQTENHLDGTQNEANFNEAENAIGGGDYPCKIHHTNYHGIPSTIVERIGGSDVYYNLCSEYNAENKSCPLPSIKYIIDEFDITLDEFAEAVRLVYCPYYDLDVLFNGTLEDADELFSNQDWIIFTCSSLSTCYRNLFDEIENKYPDETKEITEGMRHLSIPELVKLLDIKREDLEEMIKKSSDDGSKETYNYNLDMLYGSDGEIIFEKPDDVSTYELDEMFCRTGRHAE